MEKIGPSPPVLFAEDGDLLIDEPISGIEYKFDRVEDDSKRAAEIGIIEQNIAKWTSE